MFPKTSSQTNLPKAKCQTCGKNASHITHRYIYAYFSPPFIQLFLIPWSGMEPNVYQSTLVTWHLISTERFLPSNAGESFPGMIMFFSKMWGCPLSILRIDSQQGGCWQAIILQMVSSHWPPILIVPIAVSNFLQCGAKDKTKWNNCSKVADYEISVQKFQYLFENCFSLPNIIQCWLTAHKVHFVLWGCSAGISLCKATAEAAKKGVFTLRAGN